MNTIVLVGDKFKDFAEFHSEVMTLRDFERGLWDREFAADDVLAIGQGICKQRFDEILDVIASLAASSTPRLENLAQIADQLDAVQQQSVHKARRENVSISMPRQVSADRYVSKLALHDDNELLSDHMTGQHIQGMVLTEAARQMMLSVSEHYLLRPDERGQCYFVLHEVNARYLQFAFPLDIDVELIVQEQERVGRGTLRARTRIRFLQQQSELAQIDIFYAAYPRSFIATKERAMAAERLSAYVMALAQGTDVAA